MLRRRRKAFTLIELLVVIAIIAILAAILFPVLSRARASAQKTISISNLRQFSLSMVMYLTDNNDTFHKGADMNVGASNGFGAHNDIDGWAEWPWFYGPYMKNVQILDDPISPDGIDTLKATNWSVPGKTPGYDGNYGYNYSGLTRDQGTMPRQSTGIDDPSGTFAFFTSGDPAVRPATSDSDNTFNGLLEELDINQRCESASGMWPRITKENAFRHFKKAIMVYVDGHVGQVGWSQMLTRNGDDVAPWMIEWDDCAGACPPPRVGPTFCFDPAALPD